MSDQFMNWVAASKNIANQSGECICPECGNRGLQFQFVGNSESKMGHVYIWCDNCMHGVHISRTAIPDGVEYLPMDVSADVMNQKVPKYKLVS